MIETLSMPVISTAHITEEEANQAHGGYPAYAMVGEYGFIVYIAQDPNEWNEGDLERFPALADCARWAQKLGYEWIRFDRDAETVPYLKTYEW